MSRVIPVKIPGCPYPVVLGHRHLARLPTWIHRCDLGGDPVVVTHRAIWRRFGARLGSALAAVGPVRVVFVPESERAKSMAQLTQVLMRLSSLDGFGRRLFVVAFGGGVVGDLAGLAAALYRRGVPYLQVPTTLLAQVDSSLGGKTAVDLPHGKNLVGAFYQPHLVFIDTQWLASLPRRQLVSGLAEVIKCGVICDAALFRNLKRRRRAVLSRDPTSLQAVIARAVRIKAKIVASDERETTGRRSLLNFGHTIGHAIEAATGYDGRTTHGEAIAIGMSAAASLAARLGLCATTVAKELDALLATYGLPRTARGVEPAAVLAALAHDKKVRAGRLRWVLPTRMGHVVVTPDVPESLVRAIIWERVTPPLKRSLAP